MSVKKELLRAENLCFSYESTPILKNVSMTIYSGERIAVMGQNGAGKSTLLLNLNGVYEPDSGRLFLKGEPITKRNINSLRRMVGFVFQNADDQLIASTVRSEISFGPMNLKLPRAEVMACVDNAIEYMDLKAMENRPPHYLSGGEKKKVSIADIIAMKSEVMIFDEPMSALDNDGRESVEKILERLHKADTALMVATHDSDFAFSFADRIVVLIDGEIAADAVPEKIFSNEELIKKAHIKKPQLMELYEALKESGAIKNISCPKNLEQLLKIIREEL